MEGSLSFGAAKGMVRHLANFSKYDALVLDLSGVLSVNFTSAMALNDMVCDTLKSSNRYVFFVGLRPNVESFLEKQSVLEKVDKGHIYTERHTALCHAARVININPEACKPEK